MGCEQSGIHGEKGEKIPLTIGITDNAGQPQVGVSIKFYRGLSNFRNAPGSSTNDTLAESYTLLEPVSPASDAVTQNTICHRHTGMARLTATVKFSSM